MSVAGLIEFLPDANCMKTILDPPDDLVADLLRKGLFASVAHTSHGTEERARIITDPATGLPFIQCRHRAVETEEITPCRVAEILTAQDVAWSHDAGR